MQNRWNTLKTYEAILDGLHADIICFQELKTSRKALDASTAVPGNYDGYFSLASKPGYSGVSVYVNSSTLRASKAEEGLSGTLQPKPPFTPHERVSHTYPSVSRINLMADDDGSIPTSLGDLDKEGRALVVDFGMFVLVNVYCVADSADVRYHYKMNFYYLLQERVRILVEEEGREVIVLGDLNSCPGPIDHVEAGLPKYRDVFYEPLHRSWLRDWIAPGGPLVDIVRERFPTREGMYTCWNTKINAREGNYGTRIDLILVTPGLRRWVKDADIQPSLKGSDHCPVYIDLHDSITDDDGRVHLLSEHLHTTSTNMPRICARQWDEYSGKQMLLSTYFTKPKTQTQGSSSRSPNSAIETGARGRMGALKASAHEAPDVGDDVEEMTQEANRNAEERDGSLPLSSATGEIQSQSSTDGVIANSPEASVDRVNRGSASARRGANVGSASGRAMGSSSNHAEGKSNKRKRLDDSGQVKRVKTDGQSKLSSFFQGPKAATPSEVVVIEDDEDEERFQRDLRMATMLSQGETTTDKDKDKERFQRDLRVATMLSQGETSTDKDKDAWTSLLGPLEAPKCVVHSEPSKMFRVNKAGPNKGKTFFVCSRPVGPGYDMGKSKRKRDEFKCDFFKWASEVHKERGGDSA